jgi:hypothetical protein
MGKSFELFEPVRSREHAFDHPFVMSAPRSAMPYMWSTIAVAAAIAAAHLLSTLAFLTLVSWHRPSYPAH